MKIKTTPRYRRSKGRLAALIVVLILTAIALFVSRTGGDYQSRTSDWISTNFSDYGVSILYPPEMKLDSYGLTLAGLFNSETEDSINLTVHPNPTEELPAEWLTRARQLQGQDFSPNDTLNGHQHISEDGVITAVFSHNGRIIEVVIDADEQTGKDFLQSLIFTIKDTGDYSSKDRLLSLTDVAFKAMFDSLKLTGTDPISEAPSITGDSAADDHIRMVAEARGYRLQSNVTAELGAADGYPLQKSAAKAWDRLKNAASKDGIALNVTSGYRSVDSQRQIFNSRFGVACAEIYGSACSPAQVASGEADQALDEVLATSSIPGYSRHHSGHTVDIGHTGVGEFEDFLGTPGWDWISADNYKNAKIFGFIPSYPPDAGLQGPDPEPWEYVFVGGPKFFVIGE